MLQQKTSMDKVQELHDIAVDRLLEFLKGGKVEPMIMKAAMSSYNGSTREMATWRASDAVQLSVIRGITGSREEMKKYVKATMPDYYPQS